MLAAKGGDGSKKHPRGSAWLFGAAVAMVALFVPWSCCVVEGFGTGRSRPKRFFGGFFSTGSDAGKHEVEEGDETVIEIPPECSEWLKVIYGSQDGDNGERQCYRLEPFANGKGFCNSVFLVEPHGVKVEKTSSSPTRQLILKVYSELAKARMEASGRSDDLAALDRLLGESSIGPSVYRSSSEALLIEYMGERSRTLTEADVGGPGASSIMLERIARSLARVHHGPDLVSALSPSSTASKACESSNMLWASLEVLLERIPDPAIRDYYRREVDFQKGILESLALPTVLGHGDFKPSNILLLPESNGQGSSEIRFIDWETAGKHYRGYDLAKLFRGPDPSSSVRELRKGFLGAYGSETKHLLQNDDNNTNKELLQNNPTSIDDKILLRLLETEALLLVPMTWLEAAVFFQASRQPPGKWQEFAEDRTQQYQRAVRGEASFLSLVDTYRVLLEEASLSSPPPLVVEP